MFQILFNMIIVILSVELTICVTVLLIVVLLKMFKPLPKYLRRYLYTNNINSNDINENNIDKLLSLAPDDNIDISLYEKYIYSALEQRDSYKYNLKKNKNIAITGGYGAGKSSVIKTYFNKNNKHDVLYVSLGSYTERRDSDEKDLENSILQQIIYTVRPHVLPYSRIRRIDKEPSRHSIIDIWMSAIVTILLTFVLIVLNVCKLVLFPDIFLGIVLTIFPIFVYIIIFNIIKKIHSTYYIKSIGYNNNQLELDEFTDSVLNKNIDELIHFFVMTPFRIIVFEDIDRLDKTKILLTKLREINHTINSATEKLEENEHTIQFIYVINDVVFKNAETRTKIVDALIPIVPVISKGRAAGLFKNKQDILNQDEIDYRKLGRFIDNPRIVNQIINEYVILKENKIQDHDLEKFENKKIFYLAAYKVLYPRRFSLLYENIGAVCFYISSEYNYSVVEEIKNEVITENNNQINYYKKAMADRNEPLVNSFINRVREYALDKNVEFYDEDNILLTTLTTIEKNNNEIFKLKSSNFHVKISEIDNLSEEILFDDLTKISFFEKLENKELCSKIENLERENEKIITLLISDDRVKNRINSDIEKNISIKDQEDKIKNNKYTVSIEKFDDEIASLDYNYDYNRLNEFEKILLFENIINKSIISEISSSIGSYFHPSDEEFLTNIYNNIKVSEDYEISDIRKVFDEISASSFLSDTLNIKALYKELNVRIRRSNKCLSEEQKKEYLDCIFYNCSVERLMFFKRLYDSNIFVLDLGSKYYYSIWNTLSNLDNNDDLLFFYMIETIKNCDPINLPDNSYFYEVINRNKNSIKYINVDFDKIKTKIVKYSGISIEYNILEGDMLFDVINLLYNNNQININSIYTLLNINDLLKLGINKDEILQSITSLNEEDLTKKIFLQNKDGFINMVINETKEQYDDNFTVISILNDDEVSFEFKEKLIEIEKKMFVDISDISSEFYSVLFSNNLIKCNWNNINVLYQAKKEIYYDYFERYEDKIIEIPYEKDDINISFDVVLQSFSKFDKAVEWLNNGNLVFKTMINNLTEEENEILIRNSRIGYVDDIKGNNELINAVLNNKSYKNSSKLTFINNNYQYFGDIITIIDNSEKYGLFLKSNLSVDSKIDLVNKLNSLDLYSEEVINEIVSIIVANKVNIDKSVLTNIYNSLAKSNNLKKYGIEIIKKYNSLYSSFEVISMAKMLDEYYGELEKIDNSKKVISKNIIGMQDILLVLEKKEYLITIKTKKNWYVVKNK